MKPSALLALCLLLAGCALLGRAPDPAAAKAHRDRAEALIFTGQYPEAEQELAAAVGADPTDGALHLRRAEILEALGRDGEARAVLTRGRKAAADGPVREELSYRLALLHALKLDAPPDARRLLAGLPEGSVPRLDVEAVLAVGEGRGRDALVLLNRALEQKPVRERGARILYHAALAYRLLGDPESANGALYQAINLTKDLGLTKDIEGVWRDLKGTDPAGH